jgi:hypothetical protein
VNFRYALANLHVNEKICVHNVAVALLTCDPEIGLLMVRMLTNDAREVFGEPHDAIPPFTPLLQKPLEMYQRYHFSQDK